MNNDLLLWFGEQKTPITTDHREDLVLDSVISYYNDEEPELRYKYKKLFLDNGTYTATRNNKVLDIERVIYMQEYLYPDLTIPLDYPLVPGLSEKEMKKRWGETKQNIELWQNNTKLNGRLVPALHAWSEITLKKNIKWLQKSADADYLAVGSVVTHKFSQYTGFFGDRQPRKSLIDMLHFAIEQIRDNSDFKTHIMGLGSSPLTLHLTYYLGIDSTDSSGHRRKAAYGKIILPGTGERYVGDNTAKFGVTQLNSEEKKLLKTCECRICKSNQSVLWKDWKSRAIHNQFVLENEAKLAQELLMEGRDAYEKYLDKIFEKSSFNYLWRHTKHRMKYSRISSFLE